MFLQVSDMMFQIISFSSFQMAAVFFLADWDVQGYVIVSQIAFYSTLFFVCRKTFQIFAIMSRREIRLLISGWNIMDWITIGLVLGAYFVIDLELTVNTKDWMKVPKYIRRVVAFATIAQGLKFVGALRLCNEKLAVFIVSLVQVSMSYALLLRICSLSLYIGIFCSF